MTKRHKFGWLEVNEIAVLIKVLGEMDEGNRICDALYRELWMEIVEGVNGDCHEADVYWCNALPPKDIPIPKKYEEREEQEYDKYD